MFEQEYPFTSNELLEVLYSTLEFNPYFRKPASHLIKLDIFQGSIKEYPDLGNEAPEQIIFDYDKKNAFDYEDETNKPPT